jgi:nicotinamidase-related amidase
MSVRPRRKIAAARRWAMGLESLDPTRSALLSMDFQSGIVAAYAADQSDLLDRAAVALGAARQVGMTVIHVKVGFRPGLPEVSSRNPLFAAIKNSPAHQRLFAGASGEIHSAVAPEAPEVVVLKSRVSAFTGTDLEQVLRAREIDTLVMMGIATSGVVLSTALQASDADYRLVIIGDCCVDSDAAVHACLLEKVFARRASVVTANEFVQMLATLPN